MKPLKVAIAMPIFPNLVQTYILSQLAAFKSKKIDFTVIAETKRKYESLPAIIINNKLLDNVIYVNASISNIIKELLSLPYFTRAYWSIAKKVLAHQDKDYDAHYRFKSLLRSRVMLDQFDIMHTDSFYISYNYFFLKDIFSIPIVSTYHGQVPRGVKKLPQHKMVKVLDKIDAFTVNTEFAKNELISLGCSTDKIHIIPQGTNLEDFPFIKRIINPDDKIKLLTVARLSIEKGHHVAIEAMRELATQFPLLEYHIVGSGPEKNKLLKLAKKYDLQERIIFHGFKTGDELKQLFSSSHIFILPSIDTRDGYLVETQGVVLQEAQASGLAVIGSRTGGIPDVIIDDVTGLLFAENKPEELAHSIKKLIQEPDFYEKISTVARQDVEDRFDIDKVSQKIIELFNSVLKKT